jgi:hypothetical protein
MSPAAVASSGTVPGGVSTLLLATLSWLEKAPPELQAREQAKAFIIAALENRADNVFSVDQCPNG